MAWLAGTGAPSSLEAFLAASKDADLVAFGELHGTKIGCHDHRMARRLDGLGDRVLVGGVDRGSDDASALGVHRRVDRGRGLLEVVADHHQAAVRQFAERLRAQIEANALCDRMSRL